MHACMFANDISVLLSAAVFYSNEDVDANLVSIPTSPNSGYAAQAELPAESDSASR